jgi:hypothetical protein
MESDPACALAAKQFRITPVLVAATSTMAATTTEVAMTVPLMALRTTAHGVQRRVSFCPEISRPPN